MRELWEETPCEHGEVKRHPTPVVLPDHLGPGRDDVGYDWSNMCPGGSRRRVRIDLDAGAAALEGESMPWNASLFRRHAVARLAVDAALVTEEGTG